MAVDAMASSEAVELLGAGLPGEPPKEMQSLAARLGKWPLLLTLVNGQLRKLVNESGLTVLEALQEAGEALDSVGFSAFDQNDPDSRHAAASRTILVSVRQLPEKEQDLYLQISIFPEDVDIPLSVLQRYWGLGRIPARRFCEQLQDLSLLQQFDRKEGTVRLHDVVLKVLIQELGDRISALHHHLLDTFQPASGSWSGLPVEERYLWRNLADHFLRADRQEELRRLLTDFSFLQAKLNATDVNALIADYQSFAEEERDHQLIRDALRLSAHILTRDSKQLASQLLGRFQGFEGRGIQSLLADARAQPGLLPRNRSLVSPGGPLLRTLEGHLGEVTALAVVDDRRAISGSNDGTLRVWDLETGETLRTLEGHSGWFNAVRALDGHRAVYTSKDGTLRVWDLETGETLRTLEGHSGWVNTLAVVGGRWAVSGSSDETLRVWDLETGETLRTFKKGQGRLSAMAVVDGRRAVSSFLKGTLQVWDLENGEILRTLKGHLGWIRAVAVVDCRRAVSGSNDWTLRVWDLEIGKTLRTLEGHLDLVNAVAVVDDRRAVSGSSDRTLRVWDLETGATLAVLTLKAPVTALAVSPDGRVVVAGDRMGRVHFLDLVLPE